MVTDEQDGTGEGPRRPARNAEPNTTIENWRHDFTSAGRVRSLAWVGDDLVDVASGRRSFPLDGSEPRQEHSSFGADFDAVAAPSGHLVALATGTGTKGLVLDAHTHGIVRQIGRSDYQATAYRYPIALFTLPGGRTGLAHW